MICAENSTDLFHTCRSRHFMRHCERNSKSMDKNCMKSFEKNHMIFMLVDCSFENVIWPYRAFVGNLHKTWINERIKKTASPVICRTITEYVHCAVKKHNSDLKVKVSRQKKKIFATILRRGAGDIVREA